MTDETHGLGYGRVDDDPNSPVLLAAMDATSAWSATRELRAWERRHLALSPGARLLDVGCGLGDVALGYADIVGPEGSVHGVDASAAMVEAARARALATGRDARFTVGDALALDAADRAYDAVRAERTLQWLPSPEGAVSEMARVLRPGGRLCLIDTDWATFAVDVGDADLARRVRDAMAVERGRPSHVGRRLGALARDAGLVVVDETAATQRWTAWDPDASPAPDGCFSMRSLADDLVDAGQLEPSGRERFVAMVHDAARAGRFSMALTMFALVAEKPEAPAG